MHKKILTMSFFPGLTKQTNKHANKNQYVSDLISAVSDTKQNRVVAKAVQNSVP